MIRQQTTGDFYTMVCEIPDQINHFMYNNGTKENPATI